MSEVAAAVAEGVSGDVPREDGAASGAAALFRGGPVLCDGAMGSMLYARGVFINRCYDELNVTQPELIREIHREYLQAGAVVIETNTFGANAVRLERFGLEGKVGELNVAGVRLARECVEQMRDKQASDAFVAGAMGPLGVRLGARAGKDAKLSEAEAYAAFAQQVKALAEGGPGVGADLLVIETMPALNEAEIALRAAKAEGAGLPVIVMVTVNVDGNCLDGADPETAATRLAALGADAVGCNCSEGPAIVLSTIERMRTATSLPLAAMPNAGTPKVVDGRSLYLSSPEYMASCEGGGGVCGGMLRDHAEGYAGDARSFAGAGGAGDRGGADGGGRCGGGGERDRAAGAEGSLEDWRDDRGGAVLHAGGDCSAEGVRLQQRAGRGGGAVPAGGGCDQRARQSAGKCTDERDEPVRADSAARGD